MIGLHLAKEGSPTGYLGPCAPLTWYTSTWYLSVNVHVGTAQDRSPRTRKRALVWPSLAMWLWTARGTDVSCQQCKTIAIHKFWWSAFCLWAAVETSLWNHWPEIRGW